jgi:hypothetical protein
MPSGALVLSAVLPGSVIGPPTSGAPSHASRRAWPDAPGRNHASLHLTFR